MPGMKKDQPERVKGQAIPFDGTDDSVSMEGLDLCDVKSRAMWVKIENGKITSVRPVGVAYWDCFRAQRSGYGLKDNCVYALGGEHGVIYDWIRGWASVQSYILEDTTVKCHLLTQALAAFLERVPGKVRKVKQNMVPGEG